MTGPLALDTSVAIPLLVSTHRPRRGCRRGIPTTVRDTRGQEIDGACGQLAAIGPSVV